MGLGLGFGFGFGFGFGDGVRVRVAVRIRVRVSRKREEGAAADEVSTRKASQTESVRVTTHRVVVLTSSNEY